MAGGYLIRGSDSTSSSRGSRRRRRRRDAEHRGGDGRRARSRDGGRRRYSDPVAAQRDQRAGPPPQPAGWGRERVREHGRDRGRERERERDRDRDDRKRRRSRDRRGDEDTSSDSEKSERWRGVTIGQRYQVHRRIGSGSFGECYSGTDYRTGQTVCLKIEDGDEVENPKLDAEYRFLQTLSDGVARRHLVTPQVYDLVRHGNDDVLVMQLLGPSIESLYQKCGQKLSQHAVLLLAPQVIECIRHVHQCGVVYRDIKPHNFCLGRGENAHQVYIIDFGLSKEWRRKDGSHAPFKLGKHLTGTARYVGLNVHRGYEQSRRDDLESVGHMLLYLALGKLPWQGLGDPPPKRKRHDMIHEVKAQASLRDMCRPLAPQFLEYMQYCRGLDFTEEPDYDYCANLFRDALQHLSLREDYSQYDWRRKGVHVDGMASPTSSDAGEHCGARTNSRTPSLPYAPYAKHHHHGHHGGRTHNWQL